MKKILVLFIASSLSYDAFAQTSPKTDQEKTTTESKDMMKKNCVMMKDDKMMVYKNGETMHMTKEIKLTNGTTIMTNGKHKNKGRKNHEDENGEVIDINGT